MPMPAHMAARAAVLQRSVSSLTAGSAVLGVSVDIAHTPRVFRLYRLRPMVLWTGVRSVALVSPAVVRLDQEGLVAWSRYQRYGQRFLRRVYHDSELAEFERRMVRCEGRGADFLSSRWSAKEAAYKALGGGAAVAALRSGSHDLGSTAKPAKMPRLQFPELVVQSDVGGGVSMQLLGGAQTLADKAGVVGAHLSLSHDEEYAVAVVVVLARAASASTQ